MEIQYLKKLEKFYNDHPNVSKMGVSELKIEQLEQELNVKLPIGYKEFLFLAGNRNSIFGSWESGFEYLDLIQTNLKESMDDVNLHLKPHFIFGEYGNDQCLFFFLDEGENPPIYIYAEEKFHKNEKGEYVYYKKTNNSFSDCIDGFIESTLNSK